MSLFTKTVVVPGGLSRTDADALVQCLDKMAEALLDHHDRIEALKEEVARLKVEPRQSLRAKLREKNHG